MCMRLCEIFDFQQGSVFLQLLQSCEWLGFKTLPQEVQSARKVDLDLHMVRGHAHTHATQCGATLRAQRVKQSNKKQNKTVTSKDAGCNTRTPPTNMNMILEEN